MSEFFPKCQEVEKSLRPYEETKKKIVEEMTSLYMHDNLRSVSSTVNTDPPVICSRRDTVLTIDSDSDDSSDDSDSFTNFDASSR